MDVIRTKIDAGHQTILSRYTLSIDNSLWLPTYIFNDSILFASSEVRMVFYAHTHGVVIARATASPARVHPVLYSFFSQRHS